MSTNQLVALSLKTLLLMSVSFVVFAADMPSDSASQKKKRPPIKAEKNTTISLEITQSHKGLTTPKYQMFTVSFENWEPDSLHWNVPSNININSDGSWFLYAKRLANMRRTGGIIDSGHTVSFRVDVAYWDGVAGEKCAGSVIHANKYYLKSLRYKQEAWEVVARGTDPAIPGLESRIRCATFSQWIG